MKTRLIKNVLGILFVLGTFTSCSLSDDSQQNCTEVLSVSTTSVSGATVGQVNEEITLTVSYRVAETCGEFYGFSKQDVSETEKNIAVLFTYDLCNCNQTENTIVTAPYKFKATQAGTYKLKFAKTDEVFVTHTIVVE